ncbi:hypothetical protein [Salibacterium qingdaonense]|uniref:hypothetical protein n=1 Tax=Salibacterium qingdaonense TaxID=266892 RepID=UPI000B88099A|nr:hypothetical protein [Salibacterium qingdaonense]
MTQIQRADREITKKKEQLKQLFDAGLTIDNMQTFEYHAHHWFKWGAECRKAGLFEEEKPQEAPGEMDLIDLLQKQHT